MPLQAAATFKTDARRAVGHMLYTFRQLWLGTFGTISNGFTVAEHQSYQAVSLLPGSGILRERDVFHLLWELERLRATNRDGTVNSPDLYPSGNAVVTYAPSQLTRRLRLNEYSAAFVSTVTAGQVLAIIRSARFYAWNSR